MANMERFDALLAKAEAQAQLAVDAGNSRENRMVFASLAGMWLETARLEHQMMYVERMERKVERYGKRLAALEHAAGVFDEEPMPDPFQPAEDDEPELETATGF